jgi:hypothetical protein
MKVTRILFILVALACFTAFCFVSVKGKASVKDEVLRACAQLFGKPVDEKQNLFEVNRFYVLRVAFDKHDNLELLAVEPKYYFEDSHPDWKEPDDFAYLSKVEYDNLLAQLDLIKPKGKLVKPASGISSVTNLTAWHTEIYEHGSLTWGELVDLRRGDNAPYEVRWLRLNYGRQKSR